MLLLLSSAVVVLSATCSGTPEGCFLDAAPAPGVPPVRVVDNLVSGPSPNMTVVDCATVCSAHGYAYAGITGGPHPTGPQYFCYCGCELNTAAPQQPAASCNSACSPPGPER